MKFSISCSKSTSGKLAVTLLLPQWTYTLPHGKEKYWMHNIIYLLLNRLFAPVLFESGLLKLDPNFHLPKNQGTDDLFSLCLVIRKTVSLLKIGKNQEVLLNVAFDRLRFSTPDASRNIILQKNHLRYFANFKIVKTCRGKLWKYYRLRFLDKRVLNTIYVLRNMFNEKNCMELHPIGGDYETS